MVGNPVSVFVSACLTALPLYQMHLIGAHASAGRSRYCRGRLRPTCSPSSLCLLVHSLLAQIARTRRLSGFERSARLGSVPLLSMPVSRLRLLVVRAGIGWLETAAVIGILCWEMWLAMPPRAATIEMFEQAATLIACSSTFYFLAVLLRDGARRSMAVLAR